MFYIAKAQIIKEIDNAKVIKNRIPDGCKKIISRYFNEDVYYDSNTKNIISIPRVGSYEIKIYGIIIYSKLKSGSWPHIPTIINFLKKIINDHNNGNDINKYEIIPNITSSFSNDSMSNLYGNKGNTKIDKFNRNITPVVNNMSKNSDMFNNALKNTNSSKSREKYTKEQNNNSPIKKSIINTRQLIKNSKFHSSNNNPGDTSFFIVNRKPNYTSSYNNFGKKIVYKRSSQTPEPTSENKNKLNAEYELGSNLNNTFSIYNQNSNHQQRLLKTPSNFYDLSFNDSFLINQSKSFQDSQNEKKNSSTNINDINCINSKIIDMKILEVLDNTVKQIKNSTDQITLDLPPSEELINNMHSKNNMYALDSHRITIQASPKANERSSEKILNDVQKTAQFNSESDLTLITANTIKKNLKSSIKASNRYSNDTKDWLEENKLIIDMNKKVLTDSTITFSVPPRNLEDEDRDQYDDNDSLFKIKSNDTKKQETMFRIKKYSLKESQNISISPDEPIDSKSKKNDQNVIENVFEKYIDVNIVKRLSFARNSFARNSSAHDTFVNPPEDLRIKTEESEEGLDINKKVKKSIKSNLINERTTEINSDVFTSILANTGINSMIRPVSVNRNRPTKHYTKK